MRKSQVTAEFRSDIQTVWNVVTNNEDYRWRSDLSNLEIEEGGESFIEYTKEGYPTHFTITRKDAPYEYAFDMKNKNFTGKWTGSFSETESGGTRIVFTEELSVKNPIVELLSHLFMNLKKIQETYVSDLREKLEE